MFLLLIIMLIFVEFFYGVIIADGKINKYWIIPTSISSVVIALLLINMYINNYKKGQIDAINGNIKYELVKNSDGTTSWEEIIKK